ncbi:carbohydrate ABC transporter permease [Cohnella candidum]|uniref:Sugar ABC transporter permease n=1 Tax=Cohnella candidum TaxID=2674991 RepID=A0A3G3JZQ5_9BACL|nr:sugar ABC transporter permease [Cohnella candidum]AYQ73736.1 sugar ABC transporter permease [Cohnella candidum]
MIRAMKLAVKKHKESYLLMTPYMLFFLAFTILPVIICIVLGFTYFSMVDAPRFIGWHNYVRMFLDDDVFIIAVKNTLLFAFVTGPIGYLISFLVAWMINDMPRTLRSIATTIFYIPAIAAPSVYPMWFQVFSPDEYGYVNSFLIRLGVIDHPIAWLLDPKYMMGVLILIQLWLSLGISFLAFIAGLQTIDKSLYEAGVMDGIKNRFQELWYITLPSMVPQLVFGAVMQIVASFSVADVSIELAGFPSTDYAAETIVTHLRDYLNIRYELGYTSAISVVLFLMMVFSSRLTTKLLHKVGS